MERPALIDRAGLHCGHLDIRSLRRVKEAMSKPKLTYFDAPVSRGEECRLALHAAGVPFEDNRIPPATWQELKPQTPFGALPVFEVEGHPPLAQCNAILCLIGRLYGLHPQDPHEAARHEAVMAYVEELRSAVIPTMRITDPDEKIKAREALATDFLQTWGANVERQLGDGPFFAGPQLHVVDIKLYMAVRWFASGNVEHVPTTVFSAFPKLTRVFEAVREDPRIKAWYAKTA